MEHVSEPATSWNRPVIWVTIAFGTALLGLSYLLSRDGWLNAVLIEAGAAFLLLAVLAFLEGRLVREIRRSFSEVLGGRKPRYSIPQWVAASGERVAELDRRRPLETQPLVNLAAAFDYPHMKRLAGAIELSWTAGRFSHRENALVQADLGRHIVGEVSKEGFRLTEAQRAGLTGLATYLRGENTIEVTGDQIRDGASSHDAYNQCDVVVVTGAAGPFLNDRLLAGLSLLHAGPRTACLVMSGGEFNEYDGRRISEAEGMAELATDLASLEGLSISHRLLLEDRSRSFRENALLSIDSFQEIETRLPTPRPLTIAFVTAPYACRRLLSTAEECLAPFMAGEGDAGLVRAIHVAHGRNNWELSEVLGLSEGRRSSRYDNPSQTFDKGLRCWLTEYFKLIGGRAVGQF